MLIVSDWLSAPTEARSDLVRALDSGAVRGEGVMIPLLDVAAVVTGRGSLVGKREGTGLVILEEEGTTELVEACDNVSIECEVCLEVSLQ